MTDQEFEAFEKELDEMTEEQLKLWLARNGHSPEDIERGWQRCKQMLDTKIALDIYDKACKRCGGKGVVCARHNVGDCQGYCTGNHACPDCYPIADMSRPYARI